MEEFDLNADIQKHLEILSDQPKVVPAKSNENLLQFALIILFIFVSGMTCFAVWSKTPKGATSHVVGASVTQNEPSISVSTPIVSNSTDRRLDELTKRVDLLAQRQWALGLAANENAVISQMAIGKIDPALAQKYMILDEEWKLNRAPEFLRMTDQERQKLAEIIR